jgi:hypothetical protein
MAARSGVEKSPGAEAAVGDQFLHSNAEIPIDESSAVCRNSLAASIK